MSGFRSVAEATDVAGTLGLDELSMQAGWRPRQDVDSNTNVTMRRDGSVTATLRYVLPAECVEAILSVLRDPTREPSTLEAVIREAAAGNGGGR